MSLTTTGGSQIMVPQTMDQAFRLAEWISKSKMVPEHLRNDAPTCLLIIDQAARWGMAPLAVAQCTFQVKGRLGYEGKLVAAAIETSGILDGFLSYSFAGSGDKRTVTVSGKRRGEDKPREMEIMLESVRTSNEYWKRQPDQQLVYSGARHWARRWAPSVILGVYTREEIDAEEMEASTDYKPFPGSTIDGTATTVSEHAPASAADLRAIGEAIAYLAEAPTRDDVRGFLRRPDIEALTGRLGAHPDLLTQLRNAAEKRLTQLGAPGAGNGTSAANHDPDPDRDRATRMIADLDGLAPDDVRALAANTGIKTVLDRWENARPELAAEVKAAFNKAAGEVGVDPRYRLRDLRQRAARLRGNRDRLVRCNRTQYRKTALDPRPACAADRHRDDGRASLAGTRLQRGDVARGRLLSPGPSSSAGRHTRRRGAHFLRPLDQIRARLLAWRARDGAMDLHL